VALHIEEGALSIKHQGDIIIEGVPAQQLHTLTSEKGDVKLACPDTLSLTKVSAPAGTVSVTGKVSMQSIEAKAVDFSAGSLKISVINAGKSINLNGSKIEADVILAPKVDIAAGLKGRASAIECSNEIGPHKLRGGFNLGEFVSLMPTGAAILRAHGIDVPSSEDESADEDDEPEPAGVAAESQPEPDPVESEPALEELSAEPEAATVEAAAIGLEQEEAEAAAGPIEDNSTTEEFPSPEFEFPDPDPDPEDVSDPVEDVDEAVLAMPEVEEEIAAEPAEASTEDEVSQQLREILEYMGGAYEPGEVPQPVQRIFGYVEGNDLDGLRNNLSPLWQDLFKEIQTSGKYHANAVTRSFRAIRELLGPPSN
jgi:hypothetical protein